MSFFKKLFSSNDKDSSKTDKKTGTNIKKDLNPEHQQIVELYTQKNPTPFTSKEILESIAEELGKKPGGVRSILSKAGVYVKQEKLTYKNNKELLFQRIADGKDWWDYSSLSDELRNDKEIASMGVANNSRSYCDLPNKFKYDKEFLLSTIDRLVTEKKEDEIKILFSRSLNDYDNDDYTLTHFKDDREVLLKAWNSSNPKTRDLSDFQDFVIKEGTVLQRDKEFMLEAVKENPMNFLHVGTVLRNDSSLLDLVSADDFSDYCDRVYPSLLKERYGDDEDEDYDDDDDEDEVIEIP